MEAMMSDYMARALKELEPIWEHFDDDMTAEDWCWEFLKRNAEFQKDWKKVAQARRKFLQLSEKEQIPIKGYSYLTGKAYEDAVHVEDEIGQRVKKYGLGSWPRAIEEFDNPMDVTGKGGLYFISCPANKKGRSVWRAGLFVNAGIIPRLSKNEDVLIIDYDVPVGLYVKQLMTMYERKGKPKAGELPSISIRKYPAYLRVYDLREWGIRNGMLKTDGEDKEISWPTFDDIMSYINSIADRPESPRINSVNVAQKHRKVAQELIDGGYKRLLRYKV
jgi:hypothetical protein